MFNVGGGEILVILLLALLVLGPDKLPEYARKAGRYMNEFRRMTGGFQEEFRQAMDLSGTSTPSSSADGDDDAVHRATDGPRILPPPDAVQLPTPPPAATTEATDPVGSEETGEDSEPSRTTPAPSPKAAFTADVTPAPGTGPELITPTRPAADHEGDAGSTSAA